MISAYENNSLGKEYEPYFAWKKGSPLFNREQCIAMWQKVREQLDTLYNHAQPEDRLNHMLGVTQSLIHLDEETTFLMSINNEHCRIAIYRKTDELKFFNLWV